MILHPIDESILREHSHLRKDDECYYFYDYFARDPYSTSTGNSFIYNLKKSVDKIGEPHYKHKTSAIQEATYLLRDTMMAHFNISQKTPFTVIPIPPSKTMQHPLYDDRMWQIAHKCVTGTDHNAVQLLKLTQDRSPSHENGQRPKPDALKKLLTLDTEFVHQLHPTLVLIDDVITNGTHFVACKELILENLPAKNIVGVFLARTYRD